MPKYQLVNTLGLNRLLNVLPKRSFTARSTAHKTLYQLIEELSEGNPMRMRKYARELREVSRRREIKNEARIQTMIERIPCKGGVIVRLIEDALWFGMSLVTMMNLQCGMGKSTAISYVIRDVIEYGDGEGILIATDSIERLKSYLTPRFDPELAEFLKAHEDQITLIESANKAEALQRMRTTPALLMTTQRYFSMSVLEINDIVQVGMNLYAQQDYLALWLADHPDKREEILSLPNEMMNETLEALRRSDEVIELR